LSKATRISTFNSPVASQDDGILDAPMFMYASNSMPVGRHVNGPVPQSAS
jgi:hypothetical protein